MTDAELRETLTAASRRGARNAGVLGGGTFLMGALAALCGLLRVEPAMRHWRTGTWAAYGGMTCFLLGVGTSLCVDTTDGKHFQLVVPGARAEQAARGPRTARRRI